MTRANSRERLRWAQEVCRLADAYEVPLSREDLAWLYAVRRSEEKIWNRLFELLRLHVMNRLAPQLRVPRTDLEAVVVETIVHHMLGRTADGRPVFHGYLGETVRSFSGWVCIGAVRRGRRSAQQRARRPSGPPPPVELAFEGGEAVPTAQLDGRVPHGGEPAVVPDLARATDAPIRPRLLRAVCCRVAGLSMADTAKVLGVSEPTARKWLREARQMMAGMPPDAFARVALRVERILIDDAVDAA